MGLAGFEEKGFCLRYQPVLWLRPDGGAIVIALEALLRLQHPTQGLLAADTFLSASRESGDMASLGDWVLHRACADLATWRTGGYKGRVTVNAAPEELTPAYALAMHRALVAHKLTGDAIMIDVSPDTPMVDNETTAQAIAALQRLGVRLFLDDFGRGYASLSSLNRFSFAGLKYGRIPTSEDVPDYLILQELLEIAQGTGRSLIASRVETVTQRDLLVQLNCRAMQGFLFSDALPAEEVPELMARLAKGNYARSEGGSQREASGKLAVVGVR